MIEQIKSVKTKLKPNASQKADLHRMFGADRFIYNQLLNLVNTHHFGDYTKNPEFPKIPSYINLTGEITKLKEKHSWLYNTPNDYLQASASNLSKAFDGFYRKGGLPKFKSRKNAKQSVNMYAGSRAKIKDNKVFIPNRKEGIKFFNHFKLPEEYKITGYTISIDSVGDYWFSFTYKFKVEEKPFVPNNPIGCDLGLKETLISSDGILYPRLRLTKQYEDKLAKAQRKLNKKQKGSKNRIKQRKKVAKIHRKIANIRKHNNHNISRDLVNKSNFISLESLQVKSMIKNRRLSKAIADVAWSQLVNMISYKQTENQGVVYKIDKFYPSSKLCSYCLNKKDKLSLSERTYICEHCGLEIDRDINASLNILYKGLIDAGFNQDEIKELMRNNHELYKVKSVESEVRLLAEAQLCETERRTKPLGLVI